MAKRKDQRLGANSIESHAKAFSAAAEDVGLPYGVTLRSDEELEVWRAFTRARARVDWRDMDLILLAKVVRIEVDLRKFQTRLDAEGVVIDNKRGTPIENPLLRVIDTQQRQQLALIRSMSLNQNGSDPRTVKAQAKTENDYRRLMDENGIDGLLAMPGVN